MRRHVSRIAATLVIALGAGCGNALDPHPIEAPPRVIGSTDAAPANPRALVIAELGDDPAKKLRRFQPLADHLAAVLAPHGYGSGEVRIVPDMDQLVAQVLAGEIDLIVDSPYPALLIAERSGAVPVLRRWKGGEDEYSGVIFARSDRGITTLADLEGRYLAMESDLSTSGYFLPTAHLIANGLQPVRTEDTSRLVPGQVAYGFTGDEDNTVQRVITGKADAGAVDRKTYAGIPEESRARTVLLAETERVARHIVLVRPGLDPAVVAALKTEMEGMDRSEAGRGVLESFEKTARFDQFPLEAGLERMRSLFLLVGPPR